MDEHALLVLASLVTDTKGWWELVNTNITDDGMVQLYVYSMEKGVTHVVQAPINQFAVGKVLSGRVYNSD